MASDPSGHAEYPGHYIEYGQYSDSNVKTVQHQLNVVNGAGLVEDGDFGPKTLAAVKSFQSSRGLSVDGIVGPQTWGALFKQEPSPIPADQALKAEEQNPLYINDQSSDQVANIPNGNTLSGDTGCGWIASYNAFVTLNDVKSPTSVVNYFESTSGYVLGSASNLGINPVAIVNLFTQLGYKAKLSIVSSVTQISSIVNSSVAAIIGYSFEDFIPSSFKYTNDFTGISISIPFLIPDGEGAHYIEAYGNSSAGYAVHNGMSTEPEYYKNLNQNFAPDDNLYDQNDNNCTEVKRPLFVIGINK